jgi:hypothetical protein
MHCDEFEQRLQLVLDERREPRDDASLAAHAKHCTECDRVLRIQAGLFAVLPQIRSPIMPAGFAAGVVQEFNKERRRALRMRLVAWSLAAAAVLLLCFLPWMGPTTDLAFTRRTGSGGHSLGLANMTSGVSRTQSKLHSTQDFAALSAEELQSLVRQWVAQLADRESVSQLAVTIRPLTVTFNVAFDTLWRTLPGYHESPSDTIKTTHFGQLPVTYS